MRACHTPTRLFRALMNTLRSLELFGKEVIPAFG